MSVILQFSYSKVFLVIIIRSHVGVIICDCQKCFQRDIVGLYMSYLICTRNGNCYLINSIFNQSSSITRLALIDHSYSCFWKCWLLTIQTTYLTIAIIRKWQQRSKRVCSLYILDNVFVKMWLFNKITYRVRFELFEPYRVRLPIMVTGLFCAWFWKICRKIWMIQEKCLSLQLCNV